MKSRRPFTSTAAGAAAGLLVIVLSLGAGRVRAEEAKSALDSLPADSTAFFRVRNASDITRKFKASPLYSLRDHPDFKKFSEALKQKTEEGFKEIKGKLGFDPLDLLALIEGEAVVAVGGLDKVFANLASVQRHIFAQCPAKAISTWLSMPS